MKGVRFVILMALTAATASAHPHSGGLVVRPDGTVVAGDIFGLRLLVIEPGGIWREVTGVGHVRGLAVASDGTVYGMSWGPGGGVWKLGPDGRPTPVLAGFEGLFTLGERGSFLLAPIDDDGHGRRLEIRSSDGRQSVRANLAGITAIAQHKETTLVAAGSTVHAIDADDTIRPLAENVGRVLYGLAMGPQGPIVGIYDRRQVVEVARDGARRVLHTSEPPWAPTDVAFRQDAVYVLELAQRPCCWKGPRVRRLVVGEMATTLLTIDDGNHLHISPGKRPFEWMMGAGALALVVAALGVLRVRRRRQSEGGH